MFSERTDKLLILFLFYLITGLILFQYFFGEREGSTIDWSGQTVVLVLVVIVLFRQSMYLALSFWFDLRRKIRSLTFKDKKYRPLVSVIIPAWNEEKGILRTVESVLRSSYPKIEVVIVNDGSTDNSDKVINDFLRFFNRANCSEKKILYKYQPNGGKGRALNTGIKMSHGEIIMTLDADSLLSEQAIAAAVETFKDPKVMGAAGAIRVAQTKGGGFCNLLQVVEYTIAGLFKKSESLINSLYVVGGAAAFFRRKVFDEIGFFDTELITEDIDLSVRMQMRRMPIEYLPEAIVTTEGAKTFKDLIKQRVRWRRGRYHTLFKNKGLFRLGNGFLRFLVLPYSVFMEIMTFLEPWLVLLLAVLVFYSKDPGIFVLLILVSAFIYLTAFWWSAERKSFRQTFYAVLRAPIVWLLSYGSLAVEHISLLQSLYKEMTSRREKWQKWQRQGIGEEAVLPEKVDTESSSGPVTLRWRFFVHLVNSKRFRSLLEKAVERWKDDFTIKSCRAIHSHNNYLSARYCQYDLLVEFACRSAADKFCLTNKEFFTEKLCWLSSQSRKSVRKTVVGGNDRSGEAGERFLELCDNCQNFGFSNRFSVGGGRSSMSARERFNSLFDSLFLSILMIGGAVFFYVNLLDKETSVVDPLLMVILFALMTDGVMLLFNAARSTKKNLHKEKEKFDPSLVTCIIACYNGADVIGETLRQVKMHLPADQIIVVSDKSTDNTAEVARKAGVKVIENEKNMNKALSISRAVEMVETPLVLIMDDDVYIKDVFLPTSLITEKGYRAVSFNVMPRPTGKIVNALQIFEYRKSMFFSKALRSRVGAVSNVSGAIGLFLKEDLEIQRTIHSGQFGGEDQQRTMFSHILPKKFGQSANRGVTYYPSTVYTDVPDSWRAFFKQRSFSWGMATHETLVPSLRIIWSDGHFLLKLDRAYLIFIFLTEPIRIMLFPILLFHPHILALLIAVYFFLENIAWFRLGRKDPYWVVLASPLFNLVKLVTRFIAYFYWFRVKYDYFKKRLHRYIVSRRLVFEYALTSLLTIITVSASIYLAVHNIYPEQLSVLLSILH